MGLEITEIQQRLKEPINKTSIPGLIHHENRLRFHTEPNLSTVEATQVANQFLNWVSTLLPKPKYQMFKRFFRTPIDTVQIVNEAYQAIEKIFEGRDPVQNFEFKDKELEADYLEYRQKLRIDEVMRTKVFECFKTAINTIVLIDLETEQTTERPEPYFTFVDISQAIDWKSTDTGLEWVMLKHSADHVGFYDDQKYCLFRVKDDKIIETVVDQEHGLGQCPANWAFNIPLTYRNPDKKAALISPTLGDLDYLLYFLISKKYSDQFAAWQIYWGYDSGCDYEQDIKDLTYECEGGYLKNSEHGYLFGNDNGLHRCPKCENNISGVGSFVAVPAPDAETPNMAPPVGMVPTDVPGLEYVVSEIERRKSNFFQTVTGNPLESNNQAMNREQILSLFESRMQTIMKWKKPFEDLQTWMETIICKLRYRDQFNSAFISYGTEFYLFSAGSLLDMYQGALKEGTDHMVLNILQDNFIESKYKNNAPALARHKTMLALDPFRHLKTAEVKDMYQAGHIEFKDYYLKANFSTLVMRFERVNGPLGEYLKDQPMHQRVEMIRAIINTFIQDPSEPGETQTTEDGSL